MWTALSLFLSRSVSVSFSLSANYLMFIRINISFPLLPFKISPSELPCMWDTFSYANGGLDKVTGTYHFPAPRHPFVHHNGLPVLSELQVIARWFNGWKMANLSAILRFAQKNSCWITEGRKKYITTGFSANRREVLHLPRHSLKSLCHNIICARKHRSAPPEGRSWCHCVCTQGRGGFTLGVNSPLTMRAARPRQGQLILFLFADAFARA